VTRWALGLVVVTLVLGLAGMALARVLDRPGSRASILVSVAAGWLAAWVLWSFSGGLAARAGLLATYDGALFSVVAVGGACWQYRTAVRQGHDRGLVVFVGLQLAWLVLVLLQNGLLAEPR
jgi:lipopolysaccharide export LptBFGC system permease protein LptF